MMLAITNRFFRYVFLLVCAGVCYAQSSPETRVNTGGRDLANPGIDSQLPEVNCDQPTLDCALLTAINGSFSTQQGTSHPQGQSDELADSSRGQVVLSIDGKEDKSAGSNGTAQDAPPQPPPPEPQDKKPEVELYGFAMLDMGYDFGQVDPDWFDVERPTKLPAFANEFGHNGNFYAGVRQTRFGVKSNIPTKLGNLKTVFEWELFGVGVDAGQTTLRLRHAYGELGQFLAGQTWSPFMDPDVFPNSIEYWGPNGMVFFRNVQVRWQPVHNENHQVMIALERPGASADLGSVADRDILQGVKFRFPAPDVSGRVRYGGKRTYIQFSGIMRYIAWDDNAPTALTNLTYHTFGWGAHVSSNIGIGAKDTFKWSVVYGHGIENYMNDAPVDIAAKATSNIHRPLTGDPLPVLGIVAFYDRYWSEKWSSSIGYSMVNITDVPLQLPDSFRRGYYGLVNLLYYPVKDMMVGGEFIWGRRDNFTDGWTYDDYRVQFSARYNFSWKHGG